MDSFVLARLEAQVAQLTDLSTEWVASSASSTSGVGNPLFTIVASPLLASEAASGPGVQQSLVRIQKGSFVAPLTASTPVTIQEAVGGTSDWIYDSERFQQQVSQLERSLANIRSQIRIHNPIVEESEIHAGSLSSSDLSEVQLNDPEVEVSAYDSSISYAQPIQERNPEVSSQVFSRPTIPTRTPVVYPLHTCPPVTIFCPLPVVSPNDSFQPPSPEVRSDLQAKTSPSTSHLGSIMATGTPTSTSSNNPPPVVNSPNNSVSHQSSQVGMMSSSPYLPQNQNVIAQPPIHPIVDVMPEEHARPAVDKEAEQRLISHEAVIKSREESLLAELGSANWSYIKPQVPLSSKKYLTAVPPRNQTVNLIAQAKDTLLPAFKLPCNTFDIRVGTDQATCQRGIINIPNQHGTIDVIEQDGRVMVQEIFSGELVIDLLSAIEDELVFSDHDNRSELTTDRFGTFRVTVSNLPCSPRVSTSTAYTIARTAVALSQQLVMTGGLPVQ